MKADQDVLLTVAVAEETPVATFSWYLDVSSSEKVRRHNHSVETVSLERARLVVHAGS